VPSYDVECPAHGVHEVTGRITEVHARGDAALACGECDGPVRMLVLSVMPSRIDDQENVGDNRTDSTRGVNLGLPGRDIPLGRDATGKERYGYQPITGNELGSNRRAQEYARSHGLTPLDNGRWRSTP
jgi:hypothetical protein